MIIINIIIIYYTKLGISKNTCTQTQTLSAGVWELK